MALLEVENLSLLEPAPSRWRRSAPEPGRLVDSLSFHLPPGGSLSILGDASDGTLALTFGLLGLGTATEGTIRWDGLELGGLSRRKRRKIRLQMPPLFSDAFESLPPQRSLVQLLETVQAEAHESGGNRSNRAQAMKDVLDRVALPQSLRHRRPSELSCLDRQKAALARALLLEPKLLILHQVTQQLDDPAVAVLLNLFQQVRTESGIALLVMTDDAAVAAHFSDEWRVLSRGNVVDAGNCADLISDPSHEYTRKLIAMARLTATPASAGL